MIAVNLDNARVLNPEWVRSVKPSREFVSIPVWRTRDECVEETLEAAASALELLQKRVAELERRNP